MRGPRITTPKAEALAYRIWGYAEPRGWNVTLADICRHTGEREARCRGVMLHRGWLSRIRSGAGGAAPYPDPEDLTALMSA